VRNAVTNGPLYHPWVTSTTCESVMTASRKSQMKSKLLHLNNTINMT